MLKAICEIPTPDAVKVDHLSCIISAAPANVVDWLSAVGTVAAAVIALVVGLFSWAASRQAQKVSNAAFAHSQRESKDLRDERRRESQNQESAQARKVAAWLSPDAKQEYCVMVQNGSDQPIWEIELTHWSLGGSTFAQFPVLPPGNTREIKVEKTVRERFPVESAEVPIEEVVSIWFRDNAGVKWSRGKSASSLPERVSGG